MTSSIRRWLGCLIVLAVAAAASVAAAEAAKKPATATAPGASPGYSLAPAPVWVRAIPVDSLPAPAPSPLQVLLMDRQTQVGGAGGTQRYVHVLRQVNDAAGLQKGAQIELEFDPSYQKLVWHQLDVVRGNQRIDKRGAGLIKLLHREQQLERQVVDGRKTASVVLDDLRVGDRVEWAVSLVGDNPVFAGKFVDQEWMSTSQGPAGLVSLRMLWPAQRKINYRVSEPTVTVSDTTQGGQRELLLQRRQVAHFQLDPLMPALDYLRDLVEFSEFQDWAEIAAWAEQLFARSMQLSPAVAARADELARGAATPEQRLRAALDFVQREVRYFGTEVGAGSHQPASAETVLRQRFGDCKDKSSLLATLLTRMGIPATPVLVPVFLREGVATRLPSPLVFDHAIVAVNLPDAPTLWLDSTRSQQTGDATARQSLGLGYGLLARADARELTALQPATKRLSSEALDVFSFPRLADEGRFTSTTTYYGDIAEALREAKATLPAAEFERILASEIARLYPSFTQVGTPKFESLDVPNAVRVTLQYRTGNFWRLYESRSLAGEGALGLLIVPLRLSSQTPRTQAMRLSSPGRHVQRLRFEFGEDVYASGSRQSNFDERNDYFQLQIRYKSEPRLQEVEAELGLLTNTLPAGQWTRYRDLLNRIWPRLNPQISAPLLAPSQLEGLRTKLNALDDAMRSGKTPTRTQDQARARSRLLVLDEQLAAGRLPDRPRAQLLIERGQQLDLLGQRQPAQRAFEAATALDTENAGAPAGMAMNALLQGQYASSITLADRALQLGESSLGPRYTRAWARYFSGSPETARNELRDMLQTQSTERERGYGGIWLYLASRRAGADASTARSALAELSASAEGPAWPRTVQRWSSSAGCSARSTSRRRWTPPPRMPRRCAAGSANSSSMRESRPCSTARPNRPGRCSARASTPASWNSTNTPSPSRSWPASAKHHEASSPCRGLAGPGPHAGPGSGLGAGGRRSGAGSRAAAAARRIRRRTDPAEAAGRTRRPAGAVPAGPDLRHQGAHPRPRGRQALAHAGG